jgi:hypothetical protein
MSVGKFCQRLHDSKYGKNDRKRFPKWIRRGWPSQNGWVPERHKMPHPQLLTKIESSR